MPQFTRALLFQLIWFSPQLSFAAPAVQCIAGDAKEMGLVKAFENTTSPENEPIHKWRQQRAEQQKNCDTMGLFISQLNSRVSHLGKSLQFLKKETPSFASINPKCVEASMKSLPSGVMSVRTRQPVGENPPPNKECYEEEFNGKRLFNCPTEAHICNSTNPQDKNNKILNAVTPCMTSEMAEYVAWLLSNAATCFSPPDDPIDPMILFKKLNNESMFGFFLNSRNGSGIHQLTPIAEKEMLAPERGYNKVFKTPKALFSGLIKSNPAQKKACDPFKKALELTPSQSIDSSLPAGKCHLLQPGLGLTRSIMLGVGNFVHMAHSFFVNEKKVKFTADNQIKITTEEKNISASQVLRDLGFDPKQSKKARELRDKIALTYYSAAGPGVVKSVLELIGAQIKCPPKPKDCAYAKLDKTMKLEKIDELFESEMSKEYKKRGLPDYLNEINTRFGQTKKRLQPGDGPCIL